MMTFPHHGGEGKGEKMSKAILILDMPKSCNVCRLRAWDENIGDYCTALGIERVRQYMDEYVRAGICPLVEAIGYIQPLGHMVSWEDESDVD